MDGALYDAVLRTFKVERKHVFACSCVCVNENEEESAFAVRECVGWEPLSQFLLNGSARASCYVIFYSDAVGNMTCPGKC